MSSATNERRSEVTARPENTPKSSGRPRPEALRSDSAAVKEPRPLDRSTRPGEDARPVSPAGIAPEDGRSATRNRRLEPGDQLGDARAAQLEAGRVDHQPARDRGDRVDLDQAVLAQGLAGLGDVDDPVAQAGQRAELDRPRQLDDLGGEAASAQVIAGQPRVLGGDPDM